MGLPELIAGNGIKEERGAFVEERLEPKKIVGEGCFDCGLGWVGGWLRSRYGLGRWVGGWEDLLRKRTIRVK